MHNFSSVEIEQKQQKQQKINWNKIKNKAKLLRNRRRGEKRTKQRDII